MWTVARFAEDPDRRAREENLAAFRERLMQNCNAMPATQRQIAKNVAKMRLDLGLGDTDGEEIGGSSRSRNYLMVFKLGKSALVTNPTSVRW